MVFGFLGPNGAGKTTTIRLLLGLLEPTSGVAEVLGFDTRRDPNHVRSAAGVVLEHPGLYEELGAEDNLEFHGRACGLPTPERRARIRLALESMGLWDRRREPVRGWSRGMQQRLALARALLARPPLVFLDEPTVGLDVMAAVAVRDAIASEARDAGTTIFLTTHNMAEVEQLCPMVAVIREGRLLSVGSPAELRARSSTPRLVVVGRNLACAAVQGIAGVLHVEGRDGSLLVDLDPTADAAAVVTALVRDGGEVGEVRRETATLEEAFVRLMEEAPV